MPGAIKYVGLTTEYYKGDRSMRESGFDISFRFGPYGAETHHYAPVCLNSLLYKTETDLEAMATLLDDKQAAAQWRERSETRQNIIQTLLWNQQRGLFFDYDFTTNTQSSYEYAAAFYPLWAGLATAEQAGSVVKSLPLFEHAGGLAMSTRETGVQWDYPFGWAPMQLLAVEGLRRRLQSRSRPHLLQVSFHGADQLRARWKYSREIRRGFRLIELQARRRLPRQHRGVRLDQRGFSRTPAHLAGGIFEPLNRATLPYLSTLSTSDLETKPSLLPRSLLLKL